MVDISLGDEMSILCLFSTSNLLVASLGVPFSPLSQGRKCITLPVAFQYLKYQIVLTIINYYSGS